MQRPSHVRITNTDMIREMGSHAVLSTNKAELARYKQTRQQKLKEKAQQASLERRVAALEETVNNLLRALQHGHQIHPSE